MKQAGMPALSKYPEKFKRQGCIACRFVLGPDIRDLRLNSGSPRDAAPGPQSQVLRETGSTPDMHVAIR